jgi:glycosyltransferase involved in cell wall biosynthesis
MPRHDICIVGLKCYDLLNGEAVPRYLGGIEKLLVNLARGLSGAGFDTAFITYDHGQPDTEIVDGITLYKAFSEEDGIPGLRFFHPRMTGLWSAMRRVDAAIYIQMGAGSEAGRVALGAHYLCKSRRAFVFSLASDKDAHRTAIARFPYRERLLYQYGLRTADLLISQTQTQRETMLGSYGHDSVVLPMPIESQQDVDIAAKAMVEEGSHHLLWVGRIIETKRLELLFKIARRCPDVKFDVVGTPNSETEYYKNLVREAEEIENVILHGRVAEGVLPQLYQASTLLLCTSILEGFPATFLEAWSYATPVVTTFDPDGVVAENELGEVVETEDEFVDVIQRFTSERVLREEYCSRVKQFFEENYTVKAILPKYRSHLKRLMDLTT